MISVQSLLEGNTDDTIAIAGDALAGFAAGVEGDEDLDDVTLQDLNGVDDSEDDLDVYEESGLTAFVEAVEGLTEAQTIVRLNKQAKLNGYTVRTALVLARRNNDPLFVKYAKFNKLRLEMRASIVKKYGARAASIARKLVQRTASGVANAARIAGKR